MNKNIFIFILLLMSSLSFADEKLQSHINEAEFNDLKQIVDNRYLRVLTTRNAFNFYIYQGRHKGYQYEMVKKFVKYLNEKYLPKSKIKIQFEMIPVDYNQLIPMLNEGKGDIIASNLTITKSRQEKIAFTSSFLKTSELIIKNKKIKNVKDVYVRKSSSYYESLKKNGYDIGVVTEKLDTVNIIELVSLGKYPATVADSLFAQISKKVFKNIEVLPKPLVKGQRIAWGVRKKSVALLHALNKFLPTIKQGTLLGNMLKNRYFKDISRIMEDQKTKRISPYDKLIKKYAKKYGWDWRLLVSLCYQESRFRPLIHNKWGAIGLFQIKQQTASEPYIRIKKIKGKKNIENNIHAGVKYLSWIKNRYYDPKKKMKEKDKIRMSLASYNAGPARVRKAIKKARKLGLNPNKWFRNVELALAKMRYMEPVNYVSEINKRYVSYKLLGY